MSSLGETGDKHVETAVLLLEHDIPTGDFSGEVGLGEKKYEKREREGWV